MALDPKTDRATRAFLKFDTGFSDMQQGLINYSDMGQSHFLNSTYDIGEKKGQGHATLPFLKIDIRHWGSPIKGPFLDE